MSSISGVQGVHRQASAYRIYGSMSRNLQKAGATDAPIRPVAALKSVVEKNRATNALPQESVDFVREYQSSLTGLMDDTNALRGLETGAQAAAVALSGDSAAIVPQNPAKVEDSIQKMVDSYNSSLKLLNDNSARGAGTLTQMKRMLSATGDEASMHVVGIASQKDGSLVFDRSVYRKVASEDPSLAQQVVGGGFGLADNLYTAAQQGLRQSAGSLLSQDIKAAKLQLTYSPLSLTASYGRNGAYAIGNYQMSGSMLNMLV